MAEGEQLGEVVQHGQQRIESAAGQFFPLVRPWDQAGEGTLGFLPQGGQLLQLVEAVALYQQPGEQYLVIRIQQVAQVGSQPGYRGHLGQLPLSGKGDRDPEGRQGV